MTNFLINYCNAFNFILINRSMEVSYKSLFVDLNSHPPENCFSDCEISLKSLVTKHIFDSLLSISATKIKISIQFFSENWYPYVNYEYKTIYCANQGG